MADAPVSVELSVGDERSGKARSSPWGVTLAWALWVLALVGGLIGLALAIDAAARPGGFGQDPITAVAGLVAVAAYASVGLILRLRRPDHTMGWLFLAIGLTAGGSNIAWGLMLLRSEESAIPDQAWLFAALVATVALATIWIVLVIAVVLLFPAGRPASADERRLLRAAILGAPVFALGVTLRPGPMIGMPAFGNPIVPSGLLAAVGWLVFVAALAWEAGVAIMAVVTMARRYRAGGPDLRHQIRWFAFGAAVVIPTGLLYIVVGVVAASDRAAVRDLVYLIFTVSLTALPVAVLFAITRYRLYDIDRIISRAFVFGALTAILAGLFAASMRLLEAVFVALTGDDSDIVIVLTTLLLTTTFTPIKSRLETVSRRWFRDRSSPVREGDASALGAGWPADQPGDAALDARIELIARRVTQEVVAGRDATGSPMRD